MNITITGTLGSGKTSVCDELRKYDSLSSVISTGSIFRSIATERGISVTELNSLVNKGEILGIDDEIDSRTIRLGKELNNAVFDSRMAWYFIPDSFKVFLIADPEEAARRTWQGSNREAESYSSLEDTLINLQNRTQLEQERFLNMYGVNYLDASNYDLIIESTNASPKEIAQEIVRNFELYKQIPFSNTKIELNTKCFYPTQSLRDFNQDTFDKYFAKENNNISLCMLESPFISCKNGYNYILDGHHHVFAAIRSGKCFANVSPDFILSDENIIVLPKKDLYDFEDIGQFQYLSYPEDHLTKSNYAIDFSNISKVEEINRDNIDLD